MTIVSLPQTKRFLNINSSDADDFLKELLEYSYDYIVNYCGREFTLSNNIDYLKGTNSKYLNLSITPIKNITSVKIDGEVLDASNYTIKNKMLFYRNGTFYAKYERFFPNNLPDINSTEYNIEVEYEYGFNLPSVTDAFNISDVPKELQYIALDIIQHMYVNSGACPQMKEKSVQTGGEQVGKKYYQFDKFKGLTKKQKAILDKYKKRGEF